MTLLPGVRFAVAPNFHLDIDWPGRLSVGASVERTAGGPVACPPWRPASAEELAALVLDPTQPGARDELPNCLCLFVVPAHLRSAFWDLLAQAQEDGAISPFGFNAFAADVASFLAFKQLPVPAGAVFELVVSRPGQTADLANSPLWGLINLGEDAASLACLNVPAGDTASPDSLPVRLQLQPGEGVRIPAGMPLASDGLQREQPEVWLLMRLPGGTPTDRPGSMP
jgi:hypothetical protein